MGEVTDLGSEGACMAIGADLPLMLFSSSLLLLMFFCSLLSLAMCFGLFSFFQPDCNALFKGGGTSYLKSGREI